jgi:hypothetical protein
MLFSEVAARGGGALASGGLGGGLDAPVAVPALGQRHVLRVPVVMQAIAEVHEMLTATTRGLRPALLAQLGDN